MEVEGPIILARRLPQPPRQNGLRRFAPVYGVRAGQKRKRHEICTATDGDSITIYEAQNGSNLASYTVPPTSAFCCKPCSVRIPVMNGTLPTRRTYCAIKDDETRIYCFVDVSRPGQLQDPTTTSALFQDADNPVIYLDTVVNSDEVSTPSSAPDLVILQQNGAVSVLSGDLQKRKYEVQLAGGEKAIRVLCAQIIGRQDAIRSVLKQRPDIVGSVAEQAPLLAAVFVDRNDIAAEEIAEAKFGLWVVDSKQIPSTPKCSSFQPLLSYKLPRSAMWLRDNDVQLELTVNASKLCVGFPRGTATYDLTSLAPRVLSEVSLDRPELVTTIPLSSSLVAGASTNHVRIYDTKWQSVQATLDLAKVDVNKRKRKRATSTSKGPIRFIAYIAQLRRILAIRRDDLLAFDVRDTQGNDGAKLAKRTVRLVDCLGVGLMTQNVQFKDKVHNIDLGFGKIDWSMLNGKPFSPAARDRLDQLAQDGNSDLFDELAMGELMESHAFIETKADGEEAFMPKADQFVFGAEVCFLITKIFRYVSPNEAESEGQLEIILPAPRVISWLNRHGFLLRHELEKYLTAGSYLSKAPTIQSGSISRAMLSSDQSLDLVSMYLQGCGSSDIDELVETTKTLLMRVIQQVQDSSQTSSHAVELGDPMEEDQPGALVKRSLLEHRTELETLQESPFTEPSASEAPARKSLRLALSSLSEYDLSTISSRLRLNLDVSAVLSLIQFLRQELFHGGHTFSSQQEPHPSPPPSDRDVVAERGLNPKEAEISLGAIIKLLSGCVDAIGPVAFFTQGDNDIFIENIIPDLRSEIARVTEAVEEASYLQGILREIIRYADCAGARRGADQQISDRDGETGVPQKPGTIVTLYSEPTFDQGDIEATGGTLRLSLRPEAIVSKTKVRKGGGQVVARSAREMHMLEGRQKGDTPLDRLVL